MLPWMSILMGEKALASSRSEIDFKYLHAQDEICHLDSVGLLTKKFYSLRARLREVFCGDGPASLGRPWKLDLEWKFEGHLADAGLRRRRRRRHEAKTRVSGRCGHGFGHRGLLLWNVQGEVSVGEERLEAAVDAPRVGIVPEGRIN